MLTGNWISKSCRRFANVYFRAKYSSSSSSASQINIEELEKAQGIEVIDEDAKLREAEIERKRNKSRLYEPHRNILHGMKPYSEPQISYHGTVRYNRKLYGQYGEASGVDPSLCWPTKEEMADKLEHERVAYPYSIIEMRNAALKKREEERQMIEARQEEVMKKIAKLEMWKEDLHKRIAKKEAEALAAKERKEKLIEEVRRHFGYKVDPKDDRFKEMLEKKEKEQKKAQKEARRKAKDEKMVSMLLNKKNLNEGKNKKDVPVEKSEI